MFRFGMGQFFHWTLTNASPSQQSIESHFLTQNITFIFIIMLLSINDPSLAQPSKHEQINKNLSPKKEIIVKKTTKIIARPISQRLVTFVHKTMDNLRYSAYKLGGTYFDFSTGV